MNLKVGDYVTRNSHDNDVVFIIVEIKGEEAILKGFDIRLIANSPLNDLVLCGESLRNDEFLEQLYKEDITDLEDRSEFFYLPPRILHIDGDGEYLDKCLDYYKKNRIMAYGKNVKEEDFSKYVSNYLKEYKPDILVITGHDAYYKKKNVYKNSNHFIQAVQEARKYEKSHDKLLIIAGACQSNYEEIIKAGADFASSPKRVNIHALDPAIIASNVALTEKNTEINLIDLLDKTKYGKDGMGGLKVNGFMYVGYPR